MQINRMKMLDLRGTAEKRIGIHDFRRIHHYLVAAGANLKTVSSLMGHANAAMTLNTYANADLDARGVRDGDNSAADGGEAEVGDTEVTGA